MNSETTQPSDGVSEAGAFQYCTPKLQAAIIRALETQGIEAMEPRDILASIFLLEGQSKPFSVGYHNLYEYLVMAACVAQILQEINSASTHHIQLPRVEQLCTNRN